MPLALFLYMRKKKLSQGIKACNLKPNPIPFSIMTDMRGNASMDEEERWVHKDQLKT